MNDKSKASLSATAIKKIDEWLLRYPPEEKRSGVMEALWIVQEENGGWLTTELMDAVAAHLEMPPIAVYEVATFYSMYNLQPVGRHIMQVCTNISCMLAGSEEIMAHCHQRLGIGLNETTPDGKVILREAECLGACIDAPVLCIGKRYHEKVTPEKIDAILAELE